MSEIVSFSFSSSGAPVVSISGAPASSPISVTLVNATTGATVSTQSVTTSSSGAATVSFSSSSFVLGDLYHVTDVTDSVSSSNVTYTYQAPTTASTVYQYTVPTSGAGVHTVVSSFTSDVGVVLPIGVGILALFLGVTFIPKIIYKFF